MTAPAQPDTGATPTAADLGADAVNRLLDAGEEMVRALLASDGGPAFAARLRRLLPAAAPPPTPDRLAMVAALGALRLTLKSVHPRQRAQVEGAMSQIRSTLGIASEVPEAPPAVAPAGDDPAADARSAAAGPGRARAA